MSNEVAVGLLGVFVAFLGVIASFIALAWIEWIKPRLYSPKLKIEFENKFPCCKSSPTNFFGDDRPAYWVRLRIRNIGRTSAVNCKGRMQEIHDGRGSWLQSYDPETLAWRGIIREPVSLAPGDFEYLDVWLTAKDKSEMVLRVYDYTDRGGLFRFRPGNYRIKISIFADNTKPTSQVFNVDWNGIYDQIKMWPELS